MVFGMFRRVKNHLSKKKQHVFSASKYGRIGEHTIVKPGSQLIPSNMYLDDYVLIQNGNNFISHKGKLIVRKYSVISSGCIIIPSTHKLKVGVPFYLTAQEHVGDVDYDIVIDEDCWIGAGCILLPNIHIGRGAVVGAGTVVTRDIPPYSVVVGVPAKIIASKFDLKSCIQHESKIYKEDEKMSVEYLTMIFKKYFANVSPIGDSNLSVEEHAKVVDFFAKM